MRLFNPKGQSTAEYAILIGLVIGVLVVMQTYMKRGIQGRFKDATDKYVTDLGNDPYWTGITDTSGTVLESQWEFDKYSAQRTRDILTGTQTTEAMTEGGQVSRDIVEKTKQADATSAAGADYQKYDYTAPSSGGTTGGGGGG